MKEKLKDENMKVDRDGGEMRDKRHLGMKGFCNCSHVIVMCGVWVKGKRK